MKRQGLTSCKSAVPLLLAILCTMLFPVEAQAFSSTSKGSVLVFPWFETKPLTATQIRIANSSPDDVDVHLVYVCGYPRKQGDPQQLDCPAGNRTIQLTGNETWVADVYEFFRPACNEGYIVAYAIDDAGREIGYDHLLGSYHIDKLRPLRRSAAQAIAIQSAPENEQGGVNGNGLLEFDGIEYQQLPTVLKMDFRATEFSPLIASELTLLSLDVIAGGANFPTRVGINYWSMNEEPFSFSHSFYCWGSVRLDVLDINFRANLLGSTHGLLRLTPQSNYIPDDPNPKKSLLGTVREIGGGYHSMRNLYTDDLGISRVFTPDVF